MRRRCLEEVSDERILGDGDFVHNILREAEDKHLRQLKVRRSGLTIADIILEQCKKGKVSPEEVKRGNRRRRVCEARTAIARRSREELGLSGAEIARHLGVNTSSINRILAHAEEEKTNK
jgi:ribosome-binding protein aMBF1 (putative translation factor)